MSVCPAAVNVCVCVSPTVNESDAVDDVITPPALAITCCDRLCACSEQVATWASMIIQLFRMVMSIMKNFKIKSCLVKGFNDPYLRKQECHKFDDRYRTEMLPFEMTSMLLLGVKVVVRVPSNSVIELC